MGFQRMCGCVWEKRVLCVINLMQSVYEQDNISMEWSDSLIVQSYIDE